MFHRFPPCHQLRVIILPRQFEHFTYADTYDGTKPRCLAFRKTVSKLSETGWFLTEQHGGLFITRVCLSYVVGTLPEAKRKPKL